MTGPNVTRAALFSLALAGLGAGALHAAEAPKIPTAPPPQKAYVIGEITVTDPVGYKAYVATATPLVAKFGGVYLARGGRTVPLEGTPPSGRVVVVEFPSLAAAEAFEASLEYKAAAAIRQKASTGRLFIVEGAAP